MARDGTPVIIGVGEASERLDDADYAALSPADLAGRAAAAALADALSVEALAPHLDTLAGVRQFETSIAGAVAPFGRSDNFPRAVAKRIGANPTRAILEVVGGQGPQHLLTEFAGRIAAGEIGFGLVVGSEAISTVRHLQSKGETRDWSEEIGGEMEDRGLGPPLLTADLARHGAANPITVYAMCENARRGRLGLSREAYARTMGELFAPFTKVAAGNPHAMSRQVFDADQLAVPSKDNRQLAEPYTRRLVARDQTNQAAAVLIADRGLARELGVPEEKFVYLHGAADAADKLPQDRTDLSRYLAGVLASRRALEVAGWSAADIDLFDLYSCFPIAVSEIQAGLGIATDDPRAMTVTGGLPYFGGAGNDYSMHAIASMVRALRAKPGAKGFVGANGGFLTKYSVGVYSTTPADWKGADSRSVQAEVDAQPSPEFRLGAGEGTVETYTVDHGRSPPRGIVIGRWPDGARFIAMTSEDDGAVVQAMIDRDPLGATVRVEEGERGRFLVREITGA